MATRTIANGGGNWNSTGTWVEGAVPTSADAVVATASSGQLTLDVTGNCLTINFTNYTNTFTYSGQTLNVAGTQCLFVAAMTVTGNGSSVITCSGAGVTFTGAGKTFPGLVSLTGSGVATIASANTFNNLTRTGTAVKTDNLNLTGTSTTVSGTLTITGNSTVNRLNVTSGTNGTTTTLTAAAVSIANADFMDIAAAGAAIPFTGTSLGDEQGNSNITFDTPTTQTHTASAGGNWSDPTKWTSRVPLPQDDVVVNASTTGTLTADMGRLGKNITFTGFAGTLSMTTASYAVFGSFTLSSSAVFTQNQNISLLGRAVNTLTSGGKTFAATLSLNAPGGSYQLQDNLAAATLSVTNGTFDAATRNVTLSTQMNLSNIGTRAISLGSGIWTLNGTGNVWLVQNGSGLTVTPGTSTIVASNVTATAKTFTGGGKTYNILTVSGDNVTIAGANTFDTLNVNTAGLTNGLLLTSSFTQTITSSFTTNGSAGNLAKLVSTSSGTAATLSKASGIISVDFMSIQDSAATGGANWYAGANSTNVSGNSGWIFTAPPTGGAGTRLALLGVG